MFHTYRKVLVITGFVFCLFSSVFAYSGGSGTAENPYQIADTNDLLALGGTPTDYNKCFILTADIDLEGQVFTTAIIAADTNSRDDFQGTIFAGTFDGNSHKITHFTISGGSNDYLGLFGYIGTGSSVKNLGIENCSVSGDSNSWLVGGLVGFNGSGSISNCYSTGAVSGSSIYVGGLAGYNWGSISNCYSTGTVGGNGGVGGLVGINSYYGSISNCYSTGSVSGSIHVGGLVGWNWEGSIRNCYSTGAVSGSSDVGGLAGYCSNGSMENCYSTGAVDGNDSVGGLIGHVYGTAEVVSNFWDVNSSGLTDGVGNLDPDPNGVTGLTTSQMQDADTYINAGWDFSYTDGDPADWFIQIDEYPILTWQISPADIYTDGKNNFRDFAVFAQYWMRKDCAIYNNYCDWADLNFNGSVDIDDLIVLMSYWLESGIYE